MLADVQPACESGGWFSLSVHIMSSNHAIGTASCMVCLSQWMQGGLHFVVVDLLLLSIAPLYNQVQLPALLHNIVPLSNDP